MKFKYQIFADCGNGLELDGCWGSHNAQFSSIKIARASANDLRENYPDVAWVVASLDGSRQYYRTEAQEVAN